MRAILLGPINASDREKNRIFRSLKVRPQDLLIGVDGGVQIWSKHRSRLNFAVGDWDSLKNLNLLSGVKHLSLPQNKSRSDLFFSALAAIEAGADELICLGVTGGRMDHHLAVLYDLAEISTGRFGSLKGVSAHGPEGDYYFLSEKIPSWEKSLRRGSLISVFGMKNGASGVTLSGLQYSLKKAELPPSSHGLSNRVSSRLSKVELKKGQLLIMIPRDGSDDYGD